MGQMLQTHDRHGLYAVPVDDADDQHSSEGDPLPRTVDRLAMVNCERTDVVPLFPGRGGTAQTDHPVAGSGRPELALRGWLVQSLLLEALMCDEIGQADAAEHALEQALELAEHDHVVLPFTVDPVPALLERHAQRHSTHTGLLAEILDLLARHRAAPARAGSAALGEPLTESEARVLRYLPTNLSKREIAGELCLSVHTIKSHMKHIYLKLDAHNRCEAVQRAREHGLLGHASRNHSVAS